MCNLTNDKVACFLADLGTPQCFPKGAGGGEDRMSVCAQSAAPATLMKV